MTLPYYQLPTTNSQLSSVIDHHDQPPRRPPELLRVGDLQDARRRASGLDPVGVLRMVRQDLHVGAPGRDLELARVAQVDGRVARLVERAGQLPASAEPDDVPLLLDDALRLERALPRDQEVDLVRLA